jgi:hypothetical protein
MMSAVRSSVFWMIVAAASCAPAQQRSAPAGETLSLVMELPADAIALTHGGAPIAAFPQGIATLQDTPVANALALTARVRDSDGRTVGLATELEDFPRGEALDADTVWDTYWTVMIVGRGSLYLHEKESLGPTVARIFGDAAQRGRSWEGVHREPSTVGPLPERNGEIVGGTGEFAGASGAFREIGTLRRFTSRGDIEATIELRLDLRRAQ